MPKKMVWLIYVLVFGASDRGSCGVSRGDEVKGRDGEASRPYLIVK